jgi:mRNA interferase MazF
MVGINESGIRQGGIYYRDFGDAVGSETAKLRPVVVIQADARNRSNLATTIVLPFTSVKNYAVHQDNVAVSANVSGLPKDSVILTFQPATINKSTLIDYVGQLPLDYLQRAIDGVNSAISIPW